MEQGGLVSPAPQSVNSKGFSFRGLLAVFYKPTEFFAELKDHPKVLVPYIVYGLLLVVFFVAAVDVIYDMQMSSPQMQERLQGQPPPPQVEQMTRYGILIAGPLALLLVPLIAALLALFWGNVVYSGNARFKQILSVMVYGELIFGLGTLLVLPMVLIKKSMLVSVSLGILAASRGPESLLYLALSKVDLFLIWEIIVVGIGLSVVYGFARNKGYVLSVLSMGMLSILHVVFSAIGKLIF